MLGRFRAITRVAALVPDYATGLSCFVDQLGFKVVEDISLDPTNPLKRWVTVSPGEIAAQSECIIVLRAAKTDADKAVLAAGGQGAGKVFLFLRTDDFEADHKTLSENGVEFLEEPRYESYGTVAQFKDKLGNKWDLLGPPAQKKGEKEQDGTAAAAAANLPKLYYFDCRGRAAAIRLQLASYGIDYVEEIANLGSTPDGEPSTANSATFQWPDARSDPEAGGRFGYLPNWVEPSSSFVVSQTGSILRYLENVHAPAARRHTSASERTIDDMAATCAELDILNPLSDLLWAPKRQAGVDIAIPAEAFVIRAMRALSGMETLLTGSKDAKWMCGSVDVNAGPRVGDFVTFEALHRLKVAFDDSENASFGDVLKSRFPALNGHYERMVAIPEIASVSAGMPGADRLGGSPHENEVRGLLAKNFAKWC